ncbi:MAG: hypothetical protein MMC23_000796 [Stictis urceolatum]|nr:hypothetical protein [Stictis urceolata]
MSKPAPHPPPIPTTSGPVLGFLEASHTLPQSPTLKRAPVLKYLGIPYARAGRFQRPIPPASWSTPLPCYDFGPKFPQPENPFWALVHSRSHTGRATTWPQSETDAHRVNIWAPANPPPKAGENLPVLVWIYGGGLENGSSEEPVYDAESLVRAREEAGQRVIVVSGNYRTNVFGFCAGEGWEGCDEQRQGLAGNYGLYDVLALFRWVRANVGAFGGDPERVTAFGESAGAFLISCLLVLEERVFDRAILQSGAPGTLPFRAQGENYRPYRKLVERFCSRATLPAARRATLRALPTEVLLEAHVNAPGANKVGITVETGPNAIFTASTLARLERGELSPWVKGVIIGTLLDEGVPFSFINAQAWKAKGVGGLLSRYEESARKEAMRLFPDDPEGEKRRDFTTAPVTRWIHEHTFEQPAELLADALVKTKRDDCPVYMFRYNTPIEGMLWGSGKSNYGVPHGMELAVTFNIEALFGEKGSPAWKSADQMGRRWVEFASGKPPGADWTKWSGLGDLAGNGISWQKGRGYGGSDRSWEEGRGYGKGTGARDGDRKWLVFKPDGSAELQHCPQPGEPQKLVQSLLRAKEDELASKLAEQAEQAAAKKAKGAKL